MGYCTMDTCVKCGKATAYFCKNCTTSYCSTKCAQEDWLEQHSFICMKKDGSRVKILILCDTFRSGPITEKLSTTLPNALNVLLRDVEVRSSTNGTFLGDFVPDLVLIPSIILGVRPTPVDVEHELLNYAIDRGVKNAAYLFIQRSNVPNKVMSYAGETDEGGFALNTSNQQLEAFRLIVGFNDLIVFPDVVQNVRQLNRLQSQISTFIEQSTARPPVIVPSTPKVIVPSQPPKVIQPPPEQQPRIPSGRDDHMIMMEQMRREMEKLREKRVKHKKRIKELEQINENLERKMVQIVKIISN